LAGAIGEELLVDLDSAERLCNLSRRFGIPFDYSNPDLEGFLNFIEELKRKLEECEAQIAQLTTPPSSLSPLSQPPTLKSVNTEFADPESVEDFLKLDEKTGGWARKVFAYALLGYNPLQMAKMLKVRKRGGAKTTSKRSLRY